MNLNLSQAKGLIEMFGGEDTDITLDDTSGVLLAWYTEYPEEGSVILGDEDAGLMHRAHQRKALEKNVSQNPAYQKGS